MAMINLGTNSFCFCFFFHFEAHSKCIIKEVRTGNQNKNWSRSHSGTLLTDLLPGACSVYIFIQEQQNTSARMAPLTVARPSHINLFFKRLPTNLTMSKFEECMLSVSFSLLRCPSEFLSIWQKLELSNERKNIDQLHIA